MLGIVQKERRRGVDPYLPGKSVCFPKEAVLKKKRDTTNKSFLEKKRGKNFLVKVAVRRLERWSGVSQRKGEKSGKTHRKKGSSIDHCHGQRRGRIRYCRRNHSSGKKERWPQIKRGGRGRKKELFLCLKKGKGGCCSRKYV